MSKKISVIVPAFNASWYLSETLTSIINQSVQPYEIIVIDDGSTDDTIEIAKALGVKVHSNNKNMGIGGTRQVGAEIASGDYIAYLSSDDCYLPNFIEHSVPFITDKTATYAAYYQCDKNLMPASVFIPPMFSRDSVIEWALRKNMYVNFSSVIIPKQAFAKSSFKAELRHGEDLIFLLDTVNTGLKWQLIDSPLVKYRIHNMAGTFTQKKDEYELLWAYLKTELLKMGVAEETIGAAYEANKRHLYPGFPKSALLKAYMSMKGLLLNW